MLIDVSESDLTLLANVLNEALQDAAIPDPVFAERMGESRPAGAALLARLAAFRSALTLSHTGAGQEEWLVDVGNQPPTEDQVTALAASAIGPANADLRGALRHYGLLRALGPGWVAAMAPTSGDQAAVPGWAVQQMQLFLGSGQPPRP
ncbi:MAG: hypothetical protein IPI38_01205 [Gemmatimonadetes bacterium]|nr:hypothetical protein [Gemmatimonadota bacterium]MBK7714042.1 hypothetical protein [Gemmatimonadota bacterium]MBK7924045.1 hypothetical protein [Gemmatimonadota bacterium]MBK9068851.1 hypothetical protein [Gemmatimonadota bacterium]MBK9693555.1 hypothetical protein [Gemmatimonadota bacterium]